MADTFLNGTDIPFYVDLVTPVTTYGPDITFPGNFELIACLTSNSLSGTTDNISTSGKCAGMYQTSMPGRRGWSFSTDGMAISITGSDERFSRNKLLQLWKAGTRFWGATFDTALGEVRYGITWISSYEETNPDNDSATFTATFQGTGEIWDQVATT